ncbi:MAG TPA: glycosyltransferase family 39 protein [Gaiellaceae bacterium]|nr:glycosyltransferase family 39 protein [Gaiellaceae bacterium]
MPDEAIYAERALGVWQHGSLPLLHGQGAGYGVLYPVLAGIPLSIGAFTHGYALLKVLQALVVSTAAVPVYLYGRRLMPQRYALAAAALTVASPLLLYSGLVMTEVLFYPLAATTLLAIARAVETARGREQAIAFALIAACVLTRVQAIVFLPVFAAAVLLDALLARSARRLRAFWAVWAITVLGGVVAVALPGLVGSYAGTLRGSYPIGPALGLTYDHLAFLILTTGIVPVLALVLLLLRPPANARAFVSVTVAACVLVVVQVGFFAARYSPHLLGRDLAALPPLLFLALMVWLARERDRPVRAILCAFGVLCVLLLAPWNHLVSANALPDSFDLALLYRIGHPATVAAIGSLIVLTLAVVSRRLSLAAVLTLLVASSVVASNEISSAVAANQRNIVGTPANWIDRAADGPVTYVYDGEAYWNSVWEERVWNHKLDRVVSIAPSLVPGPLPQSQASPAVDGALPLHTRWVVASNRLTFIGSPVAHLTQTGLDVSGLTLWQLDGPPRLATVETGVLPNGDMVSPAQIDVYGCQRGSLELTLLPKATSVLRVLFDGLPVLRTDIGGRESWSGSIPARPESAPTQCRYTILGGSLLGSTRIAFER